MIDEVMFEIRALTGQQYHNVYSGQSDDDAPPPSKVGNVVDDDASDRPRHLVAV
jgi:hypothetical protein